VEAQDSELEALSHHAMAILSDTELTYNAGQALLLCVSCGFVDGTFRGGLSLFL